MHKADNAIVFDNSEIHQAYKICIANNEIFDIPNWLKPYLPNNFLSGSLQT